MRFTGAAVLLIALVGCTRHGSAPIGTRPIVLVRAENLSGDSSLDWISSAIPTLLAAQLESVSNLSVATVERYPDAAGVPQAEVLLCRYEKGKNGLVVHCWMDGRGGTVSASGSPDSLASWVSALGRYVDSAAPAVPAVPVAALKALADHRYEDAVAEAPEFAPAYLDGITFAARQGDTARVRALLDAAAKAEEKFSPLSQVRIKLARASLTRDREGELAALRELAKLQPPDEGRQRAEMTLLRSMGRNAEAAAVLEGLVKLRPNQPDDWNQLAYLRAWAGNFDGAIAAIQKYKTLSPNQANALDSSGEIYYRFGRFAEAEKEFLESAAKDPAFNGGQAVLKAAMSRFHAGNKAGAKELYDKFAATRAAEKPALEAHWLYMMGERAAAEAAFRSIVRTERGDAAARSFVQLAFWDGARGDWAAARQDMIAAVSQQPTNAVKASLATVALMTSPQENEDVLRQQAEKMFAGPMLVTVRNSALAVALLFHGKAAAAAAVAAELRKNEAPGGDRFAQVVQARSLSLAGKSGEAAQLMKVYLVPGVPTAAPWESWLTATEWELRGK